MGVRIRYSKPINGLMQSVKTFKSNNTGELLTVELNTDNLTYSVLSSSGSIVSQGSAKSEQLLKVAARKALINSGVTLETETRNRNNETTQSNSLGSL